MKEKVQETDVYRVERLLEKRTRGSRVEYLVKWKYWSESHNTWEPEKNILDKRLIDNFYKRQKGLLVISDSSESNDDNINEDEESPKTPPAVREDIGELEIKPEVHDVKIEEPTTKEELKELEVNSSSPVPVNEDPPSPAMTEPCVSTTFQPRVKREFRKTTQLVTAATQSAFIQSRQRNFYSNLPSSATSLGSPVNEACAKSLPPLSPPQHIQSPEPVAVEAEPREKIKLIITRDRLKACPPPDVASTESSLVNTSQSLVESLMSESETERARKSEDPDYEPRFVMDFSSDEVEIKDLPKEEPNAIDDAPMMTPPHHSSCKRRKNPNSTGRSRNHKKQKRRYTWMSHESSDESDKSVYFGQEEDPPKLAPLRIQLPKRSPTTTTTPSNSMNHKHGWLDNFHLAKYQDFKDGLHDEMKITDVTIENVTVTIKEISPVKISNFFMTKQTNNVPAISPQTAMETNSDKENYNHNSGNIGKKKIESNNVVQPSSISQTSESGGNFVMAKIKTFKEKEALHEKKRPKTSSEVVPILGKAYMMMKSPKHQQQANSSANNNKKIEKLVIKMNGEKVKKKLKAVTPTTDPSNTIATAIEDIKPKKPIITTTSSTSISSSLSTSSAVATAVSTLPSMVPFAKTIPLTDHKSKPTFLSPMKKISSSTYSSRPLTASSSDKKYQANSHQRRRKNPTPSTICYRPDPAADNPVDNLISQSNNSKRVDTSIYSFPDDPLRSQTSINKPDPSQQQKTSLLPPSHHQLIDRKRPAAVTKMQSPSRTGSTSQLAKRSNECYNTNRTNDLLMSNSLRYAEFISRMNAVVNSFPFVDPNNFLGFSKNNLMEKKPASPNINNHIDHHSLLFPVVSSGTKPTMPASHDIRNKSPIDHHQIISPDLDSCDLPIDLSAKR